MQKKRLAPLMTAIVFFIGIFVGMWVQANKPYDVDDCYSSVTLANDIIRQPSWRDDSDRIDRLEKMIDAAKYYCNPEK